MTSNKIVPTPKKNCKFSKTPKKKITKVEEGLKFTPTDGEYEGIWHEVDYLIGDKGTVWDCKYEGKFGMNWAFDESDILRWINDVNH